jgi:hypothetical protein
MRFLLLYPTHANGDEVLETFLGAYLDAAAFPARRFEAGGDDPPNCWNQDGDEAEQIGLPVVKTVCPTCPSRPHCLQSGYLAELIRAQEATIAIATHKRAEYSKLAELMQGRHYVAIHENPVDLLRPRCGIGEHDLQQIHWLLCRLINDPEFLRWFAAFEQVDDEGRAYVDEEVQIRKDRQFEFCCHLWDLADALVTAVLTAQTSREWTTEVARRPPQGIERLLFRATRHCRVQFRGQPWRFLLASAAGELGSQAILMSKRVKKIDGQNVSITIRSVVGFRDNGPSAAAATWFNDATLGKNTLEAILQRPVQDATPRGQLPLERKAVQIDRDITRRTKPAVVQKLIRGVLIDASQCIRVGVIAHRPHLAALEGLEPEFRARIVKTTYFGSGDERSSNSWHRECDLIIVAGTPRVPPDAIAEYLVQIGQVGAACRSPEWSEILWEGLTESGERRRIKGMGYLDPDWRAAQCDLVRAALVQAIGRGRGILQDGCEVIVLSNEECGLRLSDSPAQPLNAVTRKLLNDLLSASAENAKKDTIAFSAVSTATLAQAVGLSNRQTRDLLCDLDRRGLVRRVGERGGWLPVMAADAATVPVTASVAALPEGTTC